MLAIDDNDVLVLQLGDPSVGQAIRHRHGEFLKTLKTRFGACIITDADKATRHLLRYAPTFILAVDYAFANRSNRPLQESVACAVRNGSVLLLCCDFAPGVTPRAFKTMILNVFNLGWEFGHLHKAVYSLHGPCDEIIGVAEMPDVEPEILTTAIPVWDVEVTSRLYIDHMHERSTKEKDAAAIAFEKLENGFIGYVGDIRNVPGTQAIIFTFMQNILMKVFAPKLVLPKNPRYRVASNTTTASTIQSSPALTPQVATPKSESSTPIPTAEFLSKHKKDRNITPLNQRGPCLACNKASTTRACSMCKSVFFCSSSCQSIAWKAHKEVCPANRITLAQAIEFAEDGNPTPLVKEMIHIHERRVAIERLIDAYRLRIEDLHNISHIDAGHYKQPPGHAPPQPPHMEEFITFLRHMQETVQIVRPHWWDLAAQTECEDLARNHLLRMYIGRKADEEEIITHYGGQTLMPKALRILGDVLYGAKVPMPVEPQGEDFDRLERRAARSSWDEKQRELYRYYLQQEQKNMRRK
ncbi:hypothetical protein Dda_3787 [Drechslerella dactyloides]|uniref:MYND-type domain-containing protein n=1 Tax=Drechslerella dactyloides TaxID=74499 RepID=A0AAD6IZE5_DREDA|nr:hypothetical protein Dda_3787 [Drechslerella dactyloides]